MSHAVVADHGGFRPHLVEKAFRVAAEAQMHKAMIAVEAEVIRKAPFRTGHLRRSIGHAVVVTPVGVVGTVGTRTFYAPYLEMGTGIYGPKHRPIVSTRPGGFLRFPAGGQASGFANGRRTQGSAGPGFRLSGQQRSGRAGANASYVFARSVKGIKPMRFFEEGIVAAQVLVNEQLARIPLEARKWLVGHKV